MSNEEILVKLRDLHEELSGMKGELKDTQPIDEETIDALSLLVSDIGGLVERAREVTHEDNEAANSDQLMDRVQKFETEHPGVTRFLSQVTDLLALIGI